MPTYDYRCRTCGNTTEVIHSMLDAGPTTCERCGGELRRVLHPTGIIFKGSGFYKTDSRSSGSASVASGTRSKSGDSEKGGGASTDGSGSRSGGSEKGGGGTSPKSGSTPADAGGGSSGSGGPPTSPGSGSAAGTD